MRKVSTGSTDGGIGCSGAALLPGDHTSGSEAAERHDGGSGVTG